MDRATFEALAGEEFDRVPLHFAHKLKNVALLVEEGTAGDGLLGLYQGVPQTARGEYYSGALPDTITLYYHPLLDEARQLLAQKRAGSYPDAVRLAIRETLWHEIGHHFGLDDPAIHAREDEGTNFYK